MSGERGNVALMAGNSTSVLRRSGFLHTPGSGGFPSLGGRDMGVGRDGTGAAGRLMTQAHQSGTGPSYQPARLFQFDADSSTLTPGPIWTVSTGSFYNDFGGPPTFDLAGDLWTARNDVGTWHPWRIPLGSPTGTVYPASLSAPLPSCSSAEAIDGWFYYSQMNTALAPTSGLYPLMRLQIAAFTSPSVVFDPTAHGVPNSGVTKFDVLPDGTILCTVHATLVANRAIWHITNTGSVLGVITIAGYSSPNSVSVDLEGGIWCQAINASTGRCHVLRIDLAGNVLQTFVPGSASTSPFQFRLCRGPGMQPIPSPGVGGAYQFRRGRRAHIAGATGVSIQGR